MQERVGIFGGTFDPIHYGHLRVAEEVREMLTLEKVVFIPAYVQPLKSDLSPAEPTHRLKMARLSVADNSLFDVDDCEICRGGASYTVDTIEHFRKNNKRTSLFLILGSDAWLNITHWYDYRRLFELSEVVVMTRPGYDAASIDKILPLELAKRFCYDGERFAYSANSGVRFVSVTWLDISGTLIRKRCMEGKSIKYLVHPEVEKYILKERLYTQ